VYARTVDLAVALVDHEGRLIGKCHNPKPIWSLARAARPEWGVGCVFCLDPEKRCIAAAEARRTGKLTLAIDSGGFVHVAVPLSLGDRNLGTLLAGQAFDRYPELLQLERVAKTFSLSPQQLWNLARQSVPISRGHLITFGMLLGTLSRAFLQERHSIVLARDLARSHQHLQLANSELAGKVMELAQSSAEKDILLNEVHHRVNNNLQVIASLLRMQAESSPDQVSLALRASQLRVESMALIHSQLYNSHDWRAVDFAEYAGLLGANLLRSYGAEPRITLRLDIHHFEVSVDKAIPAGLILNELISNALKHAFPDGRSGSILIGGRLRDGRVELSVQDDGVGCREPTEPRKHPALGMNIVNILSRQLKGTLISPQEAPEPGRGCLFRLSFPYETLSRAATVVEKT